MTKPSNIRSVRDFPSWVRMLMYSDPGVGKTTVLGTSPRCLIVGADPNLQAAAFAGSTAEVWPADDWSDMYAVHEYMTGEGCKEFDWVWLDSLTLWQDKGLDDIMKILVAEKSNRTIDRPDRGEYGMNMNRVNIWIRDMISLPVNFGITAHRTVTMTPDGDEIFGPLIAGKDMSPKIQGWMNVVGMLKKAKNSQGETVRVLITDGGDDCQAKDGFGGALGGTMVNPTIPKIVKAIEVKRAGAGLTSQARPVPVKVAAKAAPAPVKSVAKKAAPVKAVAKRG